MGGGANSMLLIVTDGNEENYMARHMGHPGQDIPELAAAAFGARQDPQSNE